MLLLVLMKKALVLSMKTSMLLLLMQILLLFHLSRLRELLTTMGDRFTDAEVSLHVFMKTIPIIN